LGRRSVIPQETCVLVACDSVDEAHYVCAMLNSAMVSDLVAASSVRGGKGFGTPGMLDYVPLRRYRSDDPRHVELVALSRQAHAAFAEEIQRDIDRLAADVLCRA
jgi:adenine-specific DNA-methyltransferase